MEGKKVPHPYHRGSEYNKPCSEYNKPLTPKFLLMLRGDRVLFSVAVVDFKIHILHLHHICKAFFFVCVHWPGLGDLAPRLPQMVQPRIFLKMSPDMQKFVFGAESVHYLREVS